MRVRAARHATLFTGFPKLAQVTQLTRRVHDRSGTHQEVSYFITSRSPRRASAAALLATHTCGEDTSRLRGGHTPHIMATLRTLAFTLIRRSRTTAVATKRRYFAYHPAKARALLHPRTYFVR